MRSKSISCTIAFSAYCLVIISSLRPAFAADNWVRISDRAVELSGSIDGPRYNQYTGGIIVDLATSDIILSCSGKGKYISSDGGETWKRWDNGRLNGRAQNAFSACIKYPEQKMAFFDLDGGCGMTCDKGKTFVDFTKVGRNWDIGDVDWSSENPQVILALRHESGRQIHVSKDGGKSWSTIDDNNNDKKRLGVVNATTWLRSEDGVSGMMRTTNSGGSWTKVSDFNFYGRVPIHYNNTLYWATKEGVAQSTDGGATWKILGTPLPGATCGPYFGLTEEQMMVVTANGFFITLDGCKTWNKVADFFSDTDSWGGGKFNLDSWNMNFAWDPSKNLIFSAGMCGSAYKLQYGNVGVLAPLKAHPSSTASESTCMMRIVTLGSVERTSLGHSAAFAQGTVYDVLGRPSWAPTGIKLLRYQTMK